MIYIPYTPLEDVERDRAEMEAFKESLSKEKETSHQSSNHDDDFYCGICGWSSISTFPHSH